jgi:hypothetical protein
MRGFPVWALPTWPHITNVNLCILHVACSPAPTSKHGALFWPPYATTNFNFCEAVGSEYESFAQFFKSVLAYVSAFEVEEDL